MHEVIDGCKACGKRLLTDGNPLVMRTCDACKAKQKREQSSRLAANRKAERHAFKEDMGVPQCEQCGEAIEDAARLALVQRRWQWSRKFCGNACRQAAFRARVVR
jgi:hypothetical protein